MDPVDFKRSFDEIDIEKTLIVINSKTFTTAETMLNARTVRHYIVEHYKKLFPEEQEHSNFVKAHMAAVSTNLSETSKFGLAEDRVFGFWDWVGGRFSVCSAVGVLPLSVHYGFEVMQKFLQGARAVDEHLLSAGDDLRANLPIALGAIGFYNTYIC